MNRIFAPSRFWKYLLHDLYNAKNNYWLSLLICGCMPVIIFFFYQMFGLIFTGHWPQTSPINQWSAIIMGTAVVILSAPSKIYGRITEKKAGSSWLMLPASSFEKFLSMLVICLVVIPVCFLTIMLGTDAILSAVFKNYGTSMAYYLFNANRILADAMNSGDTISFNIPLILFSEWAGSILLFLLGAIFFKKSKISKTILVTIGLGMAFSIIASVFMKNVNIDFGGILGNGDYESVEYFIDRFNILTGIVYVIEGGVLLSLIYARIRTLKH